jgi:hypothetical protein
VDTNSAFRKRNKEKMKLRKKPKYEIDAYHKMHELRKESVHVLKILQDVFKREELKKKINMVEEIAFENMIDSQTKEKLSITPKS